MNLTTASTTLASSDFQWLPTPRSTVGFRTVQISEKEGGTHSLTMVVDGQEYRYLRLGKHGVIERELKGNLDLRLDPPASTAPSVLVLRPLQKHKRPHLLALASTPPARYSHAP